MTSNEKSLANISFINKDFESLWTELLALVPKLTRRWDPSQANESDPLAVLLKLITIAQDKANYNIDKNILELYPLSLTQKASAFNVYDSLGYTMQWYHSGTGKVVVRYLNKPDDIADSSNIVVPRFSQVSNTESSVVFTIIENDTTFSDVDSEASLNILQGRCIDFLINGESVITSTNLDSNNRLYFNEPNIAQNGIFVQLSDNSGWDANNDWRRVTNLSQVESDTNCYQFGVDPLTNSCYIQFPEDIGSLIGSGLKIKYVVSDGVSGNVLSMTLNQFYNDLKLAYTSTSGEDTSVSANDVFSVLNPTAILNGSDPADLDEIYDDYKRTTNIVDTLVTLLDYKQYLRDYTKDNIDLVSNVQVSDRTNDLYTSYIVKTLTTDHKFSNYLEKTMSAYDLRLYPLNSSSDVTTRLGYDNTFTYPSTQDNVINALDSVKAINHDFQDPGYPVILTYDLAGQIYLDSRVTAQEAREIRSNVLTALYQTFNAYRVDFGDAPDYKKIVDTITNSDKRIQYVALSPISNYEHQINYRSSGKPFDTKFEKVDITKRSILAGKTPWAVVRDASNTKTTTNSYQTAVNISLGQEASTTLTLGPTTTEGVSYTPAKDIQAGVFFDTSKNPTILEIGPNEHISFFTPQLKTDVTYANYLFYKVTLLSSDKTVDKNTPYKLLAGESIKFYETKEDVGNNVYAQLGPDDIILANFKLQTTPDTEIPSLTAKTTISKQSLVQSVDWDNGDAIYCSSESVYTSITGSNSPLYTLLSGEYVIYLKGKSKSFVIYGEGTSIRKDQQKFKPTDFAGKYSQASSSDLSYYQESGSVDSLSQYFVEIPDEDDKLTFQSNTIVTFGEGYKLQFQDNKGAVSSFWSNEDILGTGTTVVDMFPRTSPTIITHDEWLSKGNIYYLSPSSNDWTPLPKILSGSNWQFTYSVSVYSSPVHEQTYYQFWSKSSVENNNYTESDDYVKHSQALTYLPEGESATRRIVFKDGGSIPTGTHNISSSVILASTSAPLTVDTPVEIYAFTVSNQKLYSLKDTFSDVTELGLEALKVTLPNISGVYFILPFIAKDTDVVSYLLCKPSASVDVSAYSKIGNIVSILDSSYYYSANDKQYKSVGSLLSEEASSVLLSDALYNKKFSPLYIPNANEEILNPSQYDSFFNQNHVLNRYSIAKIGNTDSLVISSLSIQ